jgi:energy-coupling factor transport system substrate-specific component
LTTALYGAVQGLGAEIIFAAFLYKGFSVWVTSLAAIGSGVGSVIMDIYNGYIEDLALWNLTLLISVRMAGAVLIAGVFAYYLVKALEATGVTNLVRPASAEDYKALDQ